MSEASLHIQDTDESRSRKNSRSVNEENNDDAADKRKLRNLEGPGILFSSSYVTTNLNKGYKKKKPRSMRELVRWHPVK